MMESLTEAGQQLCRCAEERRQGNYVLLWITTLATRYYGLLHLLTVTTDYYTYYVLLRITTLTTCYYGLLHLLHVTTDYYTFLELVEAFVLSNCCIGSVICPG